MVNLCNLFCIEAAHIVFTLLNAAHSRINAFTQDSNSSSNTGIQESNPKLECCLLIRVHRGPNIQCAPTDMMEWQNKGACDVKEHYVPCEKEVHFKKRIEMNIIIAN